MQAHENYLVRFLDGADKSFIVPVFQRDYEWKKSNCELLFRDLMDVYYNNYSSHFFGSIVYLANETGGHTEYIIIDGQQRLTTVSLLLLAIRNYTMKNLVKTSINFTKIYKSYLIDEYSTEEKKLKLKLVSGDDVAYDRLICGLEPIDESNITTNYYYFYNKISDMQTNEIEGLYEAVTKLMVVNISLKQETGDDPQLIFASLNSTGLDLSEGDKIRNYILMKQNSKEQSRLYNKYWSEIEKKSGKDTSKFIRYFLATRTRNLPNENRLYFIFKEYREKLNDTDIESILSDLLKYAEYFNVIRNAKSRFGVEGALSRLNQLEINTVYPLLFDLLNAKDIGMIGLDELFKAVTILESFIVRRIVCGLQSSALNKLFVSVGNEISDYIAKYQISYMDAFVYALLSKTQKSRFPNNSEFKEKFILFELYSTKSAIRKFFFERLENADGKELVDVFGLLEQQVLSIEHIMPQKLSEKWKDMLGENWELIHSKYLNTVGNLTLTAYNSDYSNHPFETKCDLQDKGFKFSKLNLNDFIKNQDNWNDTTIIERAKLLSDRAIKLWDFPTTNFNPNETKEWYSLDDDFDPTNKMISEFSFMGTTVECSTITYMFKKMFTMLYDIEPNTLYKSNSKYFGSNPTLMRKPYKVGKEFYIETNLSSIDKITHLQEAIELIGLTGENVSVLLKNANKGTNFDLYDISTFDNCKIGIIAKTLFTEMLSKKMLNSIVIENLLEKEYSNKTFAVNYPVLAIDRGANKGKSDYVRYYKEGVSFDNKTYYITSQWMEVSREKLYNWYKENFDY